jgi:hypothetical protein
MRGHNTACRYYRSLMYIGLRTYDTLHKKARWIGPGLCELRRNLNTRSSQNSYSTHYGE